jgi:acyl-CoA synthetase (AMP-forming)/AMP-acid ligase II
VEPRRRRDEGRRRFGPDPLTPHGACAYIGADAPPLADAEGFVDTGDMVELRGERYHFVGRRGDIINIGGLKVHPEESRP